MRITDAKINAARCAAVVAGALLLAAVPASAVAHRQHHSHAARSKSKKKAEVLVKCASVTVTCRTKGEAPGPAGPQGPAGATGAPGGAGEGIAARIRSLAPLETGTTGMPIALTTSTFGQAPGQVLNLLGEATIAYPPGSCNTEGSKKSPYEGALEGAVELDGVVSGAILLLGRAYTPSTVITVPILWFGPGSFGPELGVDSYTPPLVASQVSHTLTIDVGDDCNAAGATHFTVDSVAIDVLQDG